MTSQAPLYHAYSRSNSTSFKYTRRIKGVKVSDRVKAIADGALILKTNKTADPDKFLIWARQRSVLAFEVKSVAAAIAKRRQRTLKWIGLH